MTDTSAIGVTGTDGIQPVYDPNGRWCWWSINELWQGTVGQNRYVPKLNDYVINPDTYTAYRVTYIDPVTLIPTLVEIRPGNMNYILSESDVIFGVGPGTQADTYRVYVDKSVRPYVLAVDIRLKIAGTMASYAKIFKGSDLTNQGHVISKLYDNNGNLISENVPLELAAIDSHQNYAIKVLGVCHTTEELLDGEVVTAVIYNDQGHVVSKRQLLVENTSFIRSINASKKYVTHISLESPFLSNTDNNTINFPLNIPLNALNLMGVVSYSDGSTLRLPVDGTKFRIFGLDQYVSTIVGQSIELVLSYALSTEEVAYNGVTSDGHYITEPYRLLTVNPNNSYTVKVFGYPVWLNPDNGYQMQWWMFNLDRNIFFNVTPYVHWAANTGPFDPKGYGYLQRKSISLNLKDVSGAFNNFIHTQLVDIVLNSEPTVETTPWTVAHESISTRPAYGLDLYAMRVSDTTINVSSNIQSYEDWKQKVYLQTFPLVDRINELVPPEPTHFIVSYGNNSIEFPIAHWNQDLVVNMNIGLFKTITIRFIKRTGAVDQQLSIAAMIVKQ